MILLWLKAQDTLSIYNINVRYYDPELQIISVKMKYLAIGLHSPTAFLAGQFNIEADFVHIIIK